MYSAVRIKCRINCDKDDAFFALTPISKNIQIVSCGFAVYIGSAHDSAANTSLTACRLMNMSSAQIHDDTTIAACDGIKCLVFLVR